MSNCILKRMECMEKHSALRRHIYNYNSA